MGLLGIGYMMVPSAWHRICPSGPHLISHIPDDPDDDLRRRARVRQATPPIDVQIEAVALEERPPAHLRCPYECGIMSGGVTTEMVVVIVSSPAERRGSGLSITRSAEVSCAVCHHANFFLAPRSRYLELGFSFLALKHMLRLTVLRRRLLRLALLAMVFCPASCDCRDCSQSKRKKTSRLSWGCFSFEHKVYSW